SESYRVGLSPTENTRLFTAHFNGLLSIGWVTAGYWHNNCPQMSEAEFAPHRITDRGPPLIHSDTATPPGPGQSIDIAPRTRLPT
ncbi:MAG TPA: hypothetical protein VM243_18500, partial [Phycisphaerae bacterium]|nr:hypothetical protein [Phycisphaerae bacterium]